MCDADDAHPRQPLIVTFFEVMVLTSQQIQDKNQHFSN
jgi:hypothetical protein